MDRIVEQEHQLLLRVGAQRLRQAPASVLRVGVQPVGDRYFERRFVPLQHRGARRTAIIGQRVAGDQTDGRPTDNRGRRPDLLLQALQELCRVQPGPAEGEDQVGPLDASRVDSLPGNPATRCEPVRIVFEAYSGAHERSLLLKAVMHTNYKETLVDSRSRELG